MNRRWHVVVALAGLLGLAASPGQGPALHRVMREKLGHTQKILEAVMTNDWVGLETHSRDLEQLTNDPRWMALKYPEYARHASEFVRAVQDLHQAAVQRDSEKAPQAYIALTIKCVECHRYLGRVRLAR